MNAATRIVALVIIAGAIVGVAGGGYFLGKQAGEIEGAAKYHHISGFAWSQEEWARRAKDVRTSYNPDGPLNDQTLTLVPGDERWLDFVYWCFNNKVAEHQVEAYGGTEWKGPEGGIIFHWAPGSRWETHTLASFGFTIGHIIGEHQWMDSMFPDFFEKYGGVHGINLKDRLTELDPKSPKPWVEFLEYSGGANSPYYRYLFHQEAVVDPVRERIYLIGGQGTGFEYSFERFYHEVREVLTDAKAFQFFQMYDMYGPGFASRGGWAKNRLSPALRGIYYLDAESKWATKPGVAKKAKYNPYPPPPPIPDGIPELESVKRGHEVYRKQCVMCHGVDGDGMGILAGGMEVKPRDFRAGHYKFRSTTNGELPTLEDIERMVRLGVPNSTMPAWGQFLKESDIRDVSRYLIVLSERFTEAWKNGDKPELLPVPPVPPNLAALAGQGAAIYKKNGCHNCHGESGKGDGPTAREQKDYLGFPIAVTDLTYKWQFKNGYEPADVYRILYGGLNGTPMPSSLPVVPDEKDRWAVVAYVLSLSPEKRPAIKLKNFKRLAAVTDKNGYVVKED